MRGGTLVFAGAADPTLLDPALVSDGESFRATEQMFETLVKLKPGTLQLVPDLATKWTPSNGGKTWTFTLRPGVKFTDGTAFNAKAVCANFNRWYNWTGPFQDAGATYYYQAAFGGFKNNGSSTLSTAAVQELRRQGHLDGGRQPEPRDGHVHQLARAAGVRDAEPDGDEQVRRRPGLDLGRRVQGDGLVRVQPPDGHRPVPVRLVDDRPEARAVRNPTYWGPKAKLDRLIIRPISANTARLQALQTGDVERVRPGGSAGRADHSGQQQPEGRQAAGVQRRLRDDQLGARAVQQQARAPGRRLRPRPAVRGEELLLRHRARSRTSSCRRGSSAGRARS